MAKFRNTGAPFQRHDGKTWVDTDQVVDLTVAEAAQFAYKLEPVVEQPLKSVSKSKVVSKFSDPEE